MKKFIALFLSLIMALSIAAVPATVSAVSVIKKTATQYKNLNLTFRKPEADTYKCTVTGNDAGYIKVDAFNTGDYLGGCYVLSVKTLKVTKSTKPLITITDEKSGKEIKKFQITVTAAKKVKHSNMKMNKNVWQVITITNPYYEVKEQTLSYNKKKIKVKQGYYGNGSKFQYTIKGLKKGTATVKVKLKKTSTVITTFKIKIGDYKASIKKSYKKSNLRYNKHIKSYYLETGGTLNIGKAVQYFHSNGKYSVKIKNTKLLKTRKVKKEELTPEAVELYALKTGKTKVTVYEKRGKAKKKKIGTIDVTVKKAKDSEVYSANCALDNDGIFYEFFVNVGDQINLKDIVTRRYINGRTTGSSFKESEYKFSFTASPADVITVDPNTGIYTILALGSNKVDYTITFADGSKVSGGGSFDIVDDDFWC